jgi:hypothetical protein
VNGPHPLLGSGEDRPCRAQEGARWLANRSRLSIDADRLYIMPVEGG